MAYRSCSLTEARCHDGCIAMVHFASLLDVNIVYFQGETKLAVWLHIFMMSQNWRFTRTAVGNFLDEQ